MWFGACTSTIGTWMQSTAQAWLVYDLSKDSFYLGLDTFLAQVPIILFSLVGGVIADRMNRRGKIPPVCERHALERFAMIDEPQRAPPNRQRT